MNGIYEWARKKEACQESLTMIQDHAARVVSPVRALASRPKWCRWALNRIALDPEMTHEHPVARALAEADPRGYALLLFSRHAAGAHLAGAHLAGANLSGADLTRADLTGAHLAGANLTGAHLSGADLTGANLAWTNLTGAIMPDGEIHH